VVAFGFGQFAEKRYKIFIFSGFHQILIKNPQSHLHAVGQGNHFSRGFIPAHQLQVKLLRTFSRAPLPGLDAALEVVYFLEIQTG
jgi:hypothetical protein